MRVAAAFLKVRTDSEIAGEAQRTPTALVGCANDEYHLPLIPSTLPARCDAFLAFWPGIVTLRNFSMLSTTEELGEGIPTFTRRVRQVLQPLNLPGTPLDMLVNTQLACDGRMGIDKRTYTMIHAYFDPTNRVWVVGERGDCVVISRTQGQGEDKTTECM